MKQMKVQVISASAGDACDLYRCFGPFNRMERDGLITVHDSAEVGWRSSGGCDVVFMQRPHTDLHVRGAEKCREIGVPLIVDYDDAYNLVPLYNSAWQGLRATGKYIANKKRIIELADEVWVSTIALKAALYRLCDGAVPLERFRVIRNGWNFKEWPIASTPGSLRRFLWRGTSTHDKDLYEIQDDLIDAIRMGGATGVLPGIERGSRGETNLGWGVIFMGSPFWLTVEALMESEIDVEYNLQEPFFRMLKSMQSSSAMYGLVPLVKNEFNECKSNIAAMEMVACGILPICAARSEFKAIPGIICSDNYPLSLALAIDMRDDERVCRIQEALEWMRDDCRLETRNEERLVGLRSVVE
jgi:hypothetical protein